MLRKKKKQMATEIMSVHNCRREKGNRSLKFSNFQKSENFPSLPKIDFTSWSINTEFMVYNDNTDQYTDS
jgi:hypothetical protein